MDTEPGGELSPKQGGEDGTLIRDNTTWDAVKFEHRGNIELGEARSIKAFDGRNEVRLFRKAIDEH